MAKSPLLEKIEKIIAATGPISLAEYFHICMAHPEFGYYKSKQVIGAKADFITAPEISQMFGELIGIWCLDVWKQLGRPSEFALVELGPGHGTLMSDLLRATAIEPDFIKSAQITLVETSVRLKEMQQQKLNGHKIQWQSEISALPELPTILVANEFFDVVPIRQYIKRKQIWHERGVEINQQGALSDILLAASIDTALLPKGHENEPNGSVFETSPAREAIAQTLAEHINTHKGAALYIDYGFKASGFGDTFQAISEHKAVSPFSMPGTADLTSHVDFQALQTASQQSDIVAQDTITQAEFLLGLGLLERAGILGANATPQRQDEIRADVERLAGPEQMGELFKVLCIHSKDITPAPYNLT